MKPTPIIAFLLFWFSSFSFSQTNEIMVPADNQAPGEAIPVQRINFYVFNAPQTLDLFSRLVIFRARRQSMTRKDHFVVVKAHSSEEAASKILSYLHQKKNTFIGTLWFDSHGRYANGYASFILGNDEFSYKTINDTLHTRHIRALAPFCDEETKVGIGSCYGGATFEKPAIHGKPASRMNGDSLMIGLANLLPGATVYGTEGWVMTKPGVFRSYSYALSGYPILRKFKDEVYRPVWENMGIWHRYSTLSKKFETVNTLALSKYGSIHIKSVNYMDRKKTPKKLARNLEKLKPGILKT
jgi:hypothetical protein